VASQQVEYKAAVPGSITGLRFTSTAGQYLVITNKNVLHIHANGINRDVALPDEGTAVLECNGCAYVGTKRGHLLVVDLATGAIKSQSQQGSGKITAFRATNDKSKVLVGCSNGLIFPVDTATMTLLPIKQDMKYHNMPITSIDISDDDSYCVSAAYERHVQVWNLLTFANVEAVESSPASPRRPQDRHHGPEAGRRRKEKSPLLLRT
jgi:WD40 repeat protein